MGLPRGWKVYPRDLAREGDTIDRERGRPGIRWGHEIEGGWIQGRLGSTTVRGGGRVTI